MFDTFAVLNDPLISLAGMTAMFAFGIILMAVLYSLLILIINKLTTLPFLSKYLPFGLEQRSMPMNMEACGKLGVPQKVYSLYPVRRDYQHARRLYYLIVFSLALANLYGVYI